MALIRDCESFPFLLYFGFFVYSVVLFSHAFFLFVWSLCNAMQCILRVIACICSWWRQWRRLFDACFGSSFIFSRQTQYIRRLIFTYTFTFFAMSLSYFFSVSLSFMVYLFAAVQFYAAFFLSLQHDAHQPPNHIMEYTTTTLHIKGMRILVMLLLDTLPMLGNVLLLCFFVFFIFGIVGVQLWEGILRQRCVLQLPDHVLAPK